MLSKLLVVFKQTQGEEEKYAKYVIFQMRANCGGLFENFRFYWKMTCNTITFLYVNALEALFYSLIRI